VAGDEDAVKKTVRYTFLYSSQSPRLEKMTKGLLWSEGLGSIGPSTAKPAKQYSRSRASEEEYRPSISPSASQHRRHEEEEK